MSIRLRRGVKANYNPSKMEVGEMAVCTDTNEVYFMGSNSTKLANAILIISKSSISTLPYTITASDDPDAAYITSDMVVTHWELTNRNAMISDWSVTPGNGTVTINGSISGSTNIVIHLTNSR